MQHFPNIYPVDQLLLRFGSTYTYRIYHHRADLLKTRAQACACVFACVLAWYEVLCSARVSIYVPPCVCVRVYKMRESERYTTHA